MEDYGLEVRIARYHNIYDLMEHMMEAGKKPQQLYVEKLFMLKIRKIRLRFGEMANKQDPFYLLMIVLRELYDYLSQIIMNR